MKLNATFVSVLTFFDDRCLRRGKLVGFDAVVPLLVAPRICRFGSLPH